MLNESYPFYRYETHLTRVLGTRDGRSLRFANDGEYIRAENVADPFHEKITMRQTHSHLHEFTIDRIPYRNAQSRIVQTGSSGLFVLGM